jgi:oligopeptide transport system ATP-binding protein
MKHLLEVKDLAISFKTYAGEVQAIRGVNFHVDKGETLAIVGESGSGKSVTSQAIMKLIPMPPGYFKNGQILFDGQDLVPKTEKQMQSIRGKEHRHDLSGADDFFEPDDESRPSNHRSAV